MFLFLRPCWPFSVGAQLKATGLCILDFKVLEVDC